MTKAPRQLRLGRRQWIKLALILLVIAGIGASVIRDDQPATTPADGFEYWAERIGAAGTKTAYRELRASYATADVRTQHNASHRFGELLFRTAGVDGIAVCDHEFGDFGCHHGLAMAAIAAGGIGVTSALNSACQNSFPSPGLLASCQHGIGHGVLAAVGRERLGAALEACAAEAPSSFPLAGCIVGVFMEYNVPSAGSHAGHSGAPRPFRADTPYAPCPELQEPFRAACYHQLPQWWDKVLEKDYARIGALCTLLPEPPDRQACFHGIGNVAGPASNYDVAATIRKCEAISNSEGEIICRETASWGFASVPAFAAAAHRICEGLQPAAAERCAPPF